MSAEPELPEELRAMLAADAEEIAPPPGAREQVFDRVLVSVGVTAAVAASATTASAASAATPLGASAKWALAAVALLGTIGATVVVQKRSTARSTTETRASTDRLTGPSPVAPIVRATNATTAPGTTVPAATSAPTVTAIAPTRAQPSEPTPSAHTTAPRRVETRAADEPEDALEEEQRLLARGQRALADGHAEAVLAAVRAHSQQFARGALVEERDALEVRALLLARRMDEARAKAERFRRRYPDSVFLSAIEGRLREP